MILHFLTDDKFADYAIRQFSAPEMQSEFVCMNTAGRMSLVELQNEVRVMSPYGAEFAAFLDESLSKYSAIILHGMHWGMWQKIILQKVSANVKVAWMFWGGEIYGRHDIGEHFLAPITSMVCRIRAMHKSFEGKKKNDIAWELPIELYQRIDVCLTDEKEEYEYAKRFLGNKMSYMWYNYYTLEEMLGSLYDERCNGDNIIIGNSATDSCNYWDVLLKLKRLRIGDRKIVLPLSYGAQWISKSVSRFCRMLFPKNTMPLLDFMPREEYNKVLLGCNTMIMGHYHPQAQGNIITGLWLGMRVYLSEKCMTYQYFKRIGCVVYSMESELKKYGYALMDEKDVDQNRAVLQQWYSKENMHKRNLEIVKALS